METICNKCKAKLPRDSEFCQYCGAAIDKTENNYTPVVDVVYYTPDDSNTYFSTHNFSKKKANRKIIKTTIIAVLAVVLIAGIIAVCLGGNNNNSSNGRTMTVDNVGVRTISFSDKFTAEYALVSWENGKATEQSMIDIMDKYGSEQGGGKLYVITRGEFIEEIDEWCFSAKRKVGDYAIIENAYGYSLCYISGFNMNDNQFNDVNTYTPSYKDLGVTFAQYTIATIVADDAQTYCEYMAELDETLSKGTYNEDIKKEKATEYVNNLSLDYGQRIILFRIQFPSDTTYCNDIVEYLNKREDISYDDTVFILEELGFAVFEDGTVKW